MYCACLNVSVEVSQAGKIQKIQTYATKLGVDSTISSERLFPANGNSPTEVPLPTTKLTLRRAAGSTTSTKTSLPDPDKLTKTTLCREPRVVVDLVEDEEKYQEVEVDPEADSDVESCWGSEDESDEYNSDDEPPAAAAAALSGSVAMELAGPVST